MKIDKNKEKQKMARRNNSQRRTRRFSKTDRRQRAWRKVSNAAYRQGQIDAGLKNPESEVSAAYKRGQQSVLN